MTLDEWRKRFPVGSKVKTEFYLKERDKVRIVADVCQAPVPTQSNVFLQTRCGLYCDIAWFEEEKGEKTAHD